MAVIASQLIGKVAIEGAEKAKGDLHGVGEKAKETESSFKKLREQVARGFEFGTGMQLAQIPGSIFDALKEQFVDVIKVAMDHQQVMAQTDQVLKSTASAFHGATAAVQGHYVAVGISTKQHEALQKQLDAANYSLKIATDHWDAAKHHTQASADAFQHAKDKVAELEAQLHKVSTVLVGGKSGVAATFQATREQVLGLAESLSQLTPFSADTIQSGENLLLTFTNIGRQVFPQATQAILDVSQAMGQDLKESAIQVGKALGDPLTGMTALQRIGVTFSDEEKKQIKTMMEHNNIIGAQKVILKELATEFGGSAQAAGKTFAGALKIAQDRVEEIKIKIGTALMPILNEFLGYFEQHMLPRLDDFSNWFQQYGIPKITEFGEWFQQTGIPALNQFGQWFSDNGIPVLQQFGGMIGTVAGDLMNFVKWMHDASAPAQALKLVLGGIATLAVAKEIANTAQSVLDFGKNTASFLASDGKNLLEFFGPNGLAQGVTNTGLAMDTMGADAEVASGEVTTMGLASDTASAEVTTLGVDATATGTALAGAGGTGGLVAMLGDVTGAIKGLLGPIGALLLAFSTIGDTVKSMGDQGWFKNQWWDTPPSQMPTIRNTSKRFASGVTNFEGGLAYVHQNELLVNMPRGTNVIPASAASGMQGGSNQTLILTIDGVQFARVAMPYLTNMTRYAVGSVGW